jgi:NAD(P)H-flavin reductase
MVPRDLDRDLVLVATGVGVGPFYPLASQLLADGFDRPIELFWGLRVPEDIFLTDELDRLAREHPNFSYRISLSDPPPDWPGLRGRVTESVPPLLTRLGGKHFILCGNGSMIEEVAAALLDVGVAQQCVYEEAYFNGRHVADPAVVAAIRGRFVADDLFSAFAHREASLFTLERSLGQAKRNADPSAPSDVFRGPEFLSHVPKAS